MPAQSESDTGTRFGIACAFARLRAAAAIRSRRRAARRSCRGAAAPLWAAGRARRELDDRLVWRRPRAARPGPDRSRSTPSGTRCVAGDRPRDVDGHDRRDAGGLDRSRAFGRRHARVERHERAARVPHREPCRNGARGRSEPSTPIARPVEAGVRGARAAKPSTRGAQLGAWSRRSSRYTTTSSRVAFDEQVARATSSRTDLGERRADLRPRADGRSASG